MEKNLFEIATRERFRFPFNGQISVEDLWTLPLKSLDTVYRTLNAELKQSKEESLLETRSKKDEELENKVELVKYIAEVKKADEKKKIDKKENEQQIQRLLEIREEKKKEEMKSMSSEDIDKMIRELQK